MLAAAPPSPSPDGDPPYPRGGGEHGDGGGAAGGVAAALADARAAAAALPPDGAFRFWRLLVVVKTPDPYVARHLYLQARPAARSGSRGVS